MYIIVRDKNKIKGKSIVDLAKNLESEGWPSEISAGEKDRIKYTEKRLGRPIRKEELKWLKR